MICARCKDEPATMIHARRLRKDGTWYEVRWGRRCQRERVKAERHLPQRKQDLDYLQLANQSHQRLVARFG